MVDEPDSQHWLDPLAFSCPHCDALLFRAIHSPMYDHWQLYCDSCAKSVEVSYYDKTASALTHAVAKDTAVSARERYHAQMWAIEAALRPCSCGGRYRYDAPRRCYVCNAVVIDDAAGIDLWPGFVDSDEDTDPTPAQLAEMEEFVAAHVRTLDIWQ